MALHAKRRAALAAVIADFEVCARRCACALSLLGLSLGAREGDRIDVELDVGTRAIAENSAVLGGVALLSLNRTALTA